MHKKIVAGLFVIPFIALLSWTIYLCIIQKTGTEVRVVITGYDPRDLLSGHYIQYTIDWDKTDCHQFSNKECPEDEFCSKARWGRQCRFYIPEKHAQKLDKLFALRNQKDIIFEVIYSYQKGFEPLAKKLLINGEDWYNSIEINEEKS